MTSKLGSQMLQYTERCKEFLDIEGGLASFQLKYFEKAQWNLKLLSVSVYFVFLDFHFNVMPIIASLVFFYSFVSEMCPECAFISPYYCL